MNPREQAILDALAGNQGMSFSQLFDATGLPADVLDAALWRLTGNGCVRRCPGGLYRAVDKAHSRAVKRGQAVRAIPRMGR